jgi:hypothetical protein
LQPKQNVLFIFGSSTPIFVVHVAHIEILPQIPTDTLNCHQTALIFASLFIMAVAATSKIVLVTGANRGIGFGIAKTLSSKPGYHVLLGSRDAQGGIDAAKKLQDQNLQVEPITIEYVTFHFFLHESILQGHRIFP